MTSPVPLPLVPDPTSQPLRITPTDVSQFVRLEQCERYLRFRLAERAGQDFMEEYDVTPQRITPLLSLSGREFEEGVETGDRPGGSARSTTPTKYAGERTTGPTTTTRSSRRPASCRPGQVVVLFQPRLEAELDGWLLRGDVDLLRLERQADGTLHALIADMKSTTEVKVEHRLQVAFYHLMLDRLFEQHGVALRQIQTGVLFRRPGRAHPGGGRATASRCGRRPGPGFGLDDGLLEVVADPDAYLQVGPRPRARPGLHRPPGRPGPVRGRPVLACRSSATAACTTSSA